MLLRSTPTIASVAALMNPPLARTSDAALRHFYKYNFQTLARDPPVVQFRQHQGTLDAAEITRWVRFLGSLVLLAGRIDTQNLARLCCLNERSSGGDGVDDDAGRGGGEGRKVNFTELCVCMQAFGAGLMSVEDVDWWTRKVMGRSGAEWGRGGVRVRYIDRMPFVAWREDGEREGGGEGDG